MEAQKNIYQKLLVIQEHVSGLAKDKQAFGYKYVTGDKLLGVVKPLMNQEKLILKQEILSIENERQDYRSGVNDKNPDGTKIKNEILSKVMMKFTWIDCETGEKDENLFGANGQNGFDKGVGSALTYAERYFLLKFFHIATDQDDIETLRSEEEETVEAPVEAPSKKNDPESDLKNCKNLKELKDVYEKLNSKERTEFAAVKNEMKNKLKKS